MNSNIKIIEIVPTTYDDGTFWLIYECNFANKILTGYELIDEKEVSLNENIICEIPHKKELSVCSEYLQQLIKDCLSSDNEMVFVEYDDEEYLEKCKNKDFLVNLEKEIKRLGLTDFVRFMEDDCYITVYGGIITQFLI